MNGDELALLKALVAKDGQQFKLFEAAKRLGISQERTIDLMEK